MSPQSPPLGSKRFTAALTKNGRARVHAPFVVPTFDDRPFFVEVKTGKLHERAYIVYVGVVVAPEEALSKVQTPPADRVEALRRLRSFVEQLAGFKIGNVLAVERDSGGLPVLRKVAEHPEREPGPKLPE